MQKESPTSIENQANPTVYLNVLLLSVAMFISLWDLNKSGEIWLDDGARYCNNGAMVSDFIYSEDWTSSGTSRRKLHLGKATQRTVWTPMVTGESPLANDF